MCRQKTIKYKILILNEKNQLLDFLSAIENILDVYHAKNMEDAFCHSTSFFYHLIVLVSVQDVENICKIIRTIRVLKTIPILVLSSEDAKESVLYIEAGADAVLPFICKREDVELQMFALMRRYSEWEMDNDKKQDIVQNDSFIMSFSMRKVFWKGHELKFTKREFDFLYLLASSPERVYSYSQIYQNVWNEYPQGDITNMIWCMIRRIKKKMKDVDPVVPDMIHSVRDIGYFFKLNIEK